MGFKTWAVGEVLRAVDLNAYLAKQVIAVVTSASRPASPVEGQMIYETDTKSLVVYTGSAWEILVQHGAVKTYTPQWTANTANPSIGNGSLSGRYRRLPGRMVWVRLSWTRGSTTNLGNGTYSFSLPPNLPAETGTRWLGDVVAQDPGNYIVRGSAVVHAGGDGTRIDAVRFDISSTDGDYDNWGSGGLGDSTTMALLPTGSFMTMNLMYETTSTASTDG